MIGLRPQGENAPDKVRAGRRGAPPGTRSAKTARRFCRPRRPRAQNRAVSSAISSLTVAGRSRMKVWQDGGICQTDNNSHAAVPVCVANRCGTQAVLITTRNNIIRTNPYSKTPETRTRTAFARFSDSAIYCPVSVQQVAQSEARRCNVLHLLAFPKACVLQLHFTHLCKDTMPSKPAKPTNLTHIPDEDDGRGNQSQGWLQSDKAVHRDMWQLGIKHPSALVVLHFMVSKMNRGANGIVISSGALSRQIGVSERTAKSAIAVLREGRFVQIVKSGNTNAYIINSRVAWAGRRGARYASFNAQIMVDEKEQDRSVDELEAEAAALQQVPVMTFEDYGESQPLVLDAEMPEMPVVPPKKRKSRAKSKQIELLPDTDDATDVDTSLD